MARALRLMGMGCGLLALIATCATSISCYALLPMRPREAAHGFLSDIRASNWSAALQRTGADYQRGHDPAQLQQAVSRIPPLARHTGATFWNATMEDDTAILDGMLETPDGQTPIAVELRQVDGYWYIEHLAVQGAVLE